MTNNPTIDDVSRGTIQRAIDVIQQVGYQDKFIDYDLTRNVQIELRALLDREVITDDHLRQRIAFLTREIHSQSDDRAALQSTIAQLQARVTQLESETSYAAATHQAARDRIAELESGRGEPVGWVHPDALAELKSKHSETWPSLIPLCSHESPYDGVTVALFTAPPAVVAVVLPDRKDGNGPALSNHRSYNQGWNACLDATAALNGERE